MRSLLPILAFFGIAAGEPYKPSYRISPIDGSKIALPTKEQLAFQDREIGVLIHFDIATFLNIDGCNADPSLVPNETLFDPAQLNTDQWMQSATALGAKYATLVVKHNCGFALWPSNVTFPTLDEPKARYNYTTADTPLHGEDIVRKFITSAAIANVGHGFYYSVVVNNFLNVQQSEVRNGSLAPGQVGITEDTYNQIVYDMLTELWSNYGKLTEVRLQAVNLRLIVDLVRWRIQCGTAGQVANAVAVSSAASRCLQRLSRKWDLRVVEFKYVSPDHIPC